MKTGIAFLQAVAAGFSLVAGDAEKFVKVLKSFSADISADRFCGGRCAVTERP